MGFEKYDDDKLIKTTQSLKTVAIAFGLIWLIIITALFVTQIYSLDKDNFNIIKLVPILVGPITMLPLFINYKSFKKEIKRRGI